MHSLPPAFPPARRHHRPGPSARWALRALAAAALAWLIRQAGALSRRCRPGRRPAQHLEALLHVIQTSAHALDPEQAARSALDAAVALLGADRALLLWCTEVSGTFTCRAARSAGGADLPADAPFDAALVSRAQYEQRPVIVDTPTLARRALAAPLHVADRLVGVVYVEGPLPRGPLAPDELALLQAIAGHVAVAIETARVAHLEAHIASERSQRRLAETLAAVAATLTATLDLDEVLGRLLENLALVVPYDSATVMLRDGERFRVVKAEGDSEAVAARRLLLPSGDALLREVLATRRALALPDARGDARYRGYGVTDYTRSWMGLPLLVAGEVIGLLTIDSREPGVYGDREAAVAFTFAGQAAVALNNARLFGEVRRLASTDSLTRIHNRHQLFALAEAELAAAQQAGRPLAVLMLDIDHFKRVNDTYGHAAGDDVLRVVAERCRAALRDRDVLGRYGGEEFAVVLPATGLEGALLVAERLRARIANAPVSIDGAELQLTVSVGLATLGPATRDLVELIGHADAALYAAKSAGRNRVEAAPPG